MRKAQHFISLPITIVVAVLAGAAGAWWFSSHGQVSSLMPVVTETAYQRVMRTNTLRCGYWVQPPTTTINQETKKIDGPPVAVAEEMAKRLSLNIEWTEEVAFGTMMMGLETHRYDAICTSAWNSAGRSRHSESTIPFLFSSVVAVVRGDDARLDQDVNVANDPAFTISAIEGDLTADIAKQMFPKANMLPLPQNGTQADAYLNLASKKADMIFDDSLRAGTYIKNNPGLVKILNADHPLRVSPWVIPVGKGEHELVGLLNGALMEMLYDGSVERLVKKYEPTPGAYYFYKLPIEAK